MPERTMTEIMQDIDHLLDDLDASCRHGLLTYRRYPAEFLIEHDPRAAAANTYCHMLAESERCLLGKRGIVPKDIRGLKVFLVEDKAVLRLKRMDEDGRSRNYPTKQARDYDRGVEFPELPPPATRLTVGYLADATGTTVERVQVAKPMGREIDWCAAIVPVSGRPAGARRWIDVTRQGRL
jgi:hypothetical protein